MKTDPKKDIIRRPKNAFIIFCDRYRKPIQMRNLTMNNRDVTRALGELWHNLDPDENQFFENIAKQERDAFKLANPGFKYHNKQNVGKKAGRNQEQAHCSKTGMKRCDTTVATTPDTTMVVEPSSSRRAQQMSDDVTNGCLNPVRLAEPRVNGRIRKAKHRKRRNQTMSTSFIPDETSTPLSVSRALAAGPGKMFAALLKVAKMRRRELKQEKSGQTSALFSIVHPSPPPHSPVQDHSTLLQPFPDSVHGCQQLKPPPKKRAWKLSERDDVFTDGLVMSGYSNDVSKQNLLPEELCPDRYYSDMKAHSLIVPRKTLSSSAASLCLFGAEARESTMFSQTWNESENYAQKSHFCDETYINSSPLFDLNSNSNTPQSTLTYVTQKRQSLPDNSVAEIPRKVFVHDSDAVSSINPHSTYINYFQQQSESVKSGTKFGYACTENLAPEASWTHEVNYFPVDLSRGNQPGHQTLKEQKPKNGILSSLSTDGKPFYASSSSYSRTSASLPSRGRLVSLLSANNATDRQASAVSDAHNNGHKTLQKIENIAPTSDKQSYKQTDSQRQEEQFILAYRPNFVNENCLIHGQPGNLTEPQSSVLNLSLSQAQNLSEGKLKKKWERRMLVETTHEGAGRCQSTVLHDSNHVAVEHMQSSQKHLSRKDQKQNMSLLYLGDSEQQHQTDRIKMRQKHGALILPVEQKSVHIQPQSSFRVKVPNLSSCNSSSYSKLRQQLSQNLPLVKPDLPFADSKMKPEPEVSDRSGSYLNHSSWSSGHQEGADNSDKIKATRDTKSPTEDFSNKTDLNYTAAYGKLFMDHVLEQFFKTDLSEGKKVVTADVCEDSQTTNTECSGLKELSGDGSSSAANVKSESEQNCGPVLAGLREGTVDGFQADIVDYKMMTASCLVEKVIREFCGLTQRKDARDSAKTAKNTTNDDLLVSVSDASHMTTKPDSISNPTVEHISPDISGRSGQQASTCANEYSAQCQLTPVTVGSSKDPSTPEKTIVQPIRKSGRANRGQKYQELIKELIVQPSRERLASRNSKNPGNADVCLASPSSPVGTLRLTKRKSGHSESDDENSLVHPRCDSNNSSAQLKESKNLRMATRHRSAPSQILPTISNQVSATFKHDFKAGTDFRKDQAVGQISGSQKRKLRRHTIMRIPVLQEASENLMSSTSTKLSAPQDKKPRLSSELQICNEVPSYSLEVNDSELQLTTGSSSVTDLNGKVVSAETFVLPDLSLMQSSLDQNKTEVTGNHGVSCTGDSCQEADGCAHSSSDGGVIESGCMSFSPIISSTPTTSSTPIISSFSIMNSAPVMRSIMNSISGTNARPTVSSAPIRNSVPNSGSSPKMSVSVSVPIASTIPVAGSTATISPASIMEPMSVQSAMPVAS